MELSPGEPVKGLQREWEEPVKAVGGWGGVGETGRGSDWGQGSDSPTSGGLEKVWNWPSQPKAGTVLRASGEERAGKLGESCHHITQLLPQPGRDTSIQPLGSEAQRWGDIPDE